MAEPEPFFTEIPSGIQVTEAYNWYGTWKSWADSQKYIVEWLTAQKRPDDAAKVKALPQHEISWVSGWICRLQSKGSKLDKGTIAYRDKWLNEFCNK
jgi:hypothetical protein